MNEDFYVEDDVDLEKQQKEADMIMSFKEANALGRSAYSVFVIKKYDDNVTLIAKSY